MSRRDPDDLDDAQAYRDALLGDALFGPDHLDPDEQAALDADFPLGDGVAEMEAEVWCPYCGEPSTIGLDPGSGATQAYVEDCQVCCQPWRVHVHYDAEGSAQVHVEAADGR